MKTLLIIQFLLFTASTFYMISLNMFAMIDYEKVMNKTAYGYYNSKLIKEKAVEPVMGTLAWGMLSVKSNPHESQSSTKGL